MGSSVGGALGNVVGQQDAGQIVGGVAGEQTLLKCEINSTCSHSDLQSYILHDKGALAGASAGANVGNNLGNGLNNLVHGLGGRWNNNNCNGYYGGYGYGHHGYGYGR